MPGNDKTGPNGQGPMTGRGLGLCGNGLSQNKGSGFGRGFGNGFGRRCWKRLPFTKAGSLTQNEEKKILESELKEIDLEKQDIERRLKEIK